MTETSPHQVHIPLASDPAEERRQQARRTVAHYSTGEEDLALLLDILGLRGEAMCPDCDRPMSRATPSGHSLSGGDGLCWQCYRDEVKSRREAELPLCACGRRIADEEALCQTCRASATVDEVRQVVARLRAATGRTIRQVAELAGVNATALTSLCVPSSLVKQVRKDVLDKLLAAEQRWARLTDYSEPIRLEAAIAAPGGSTRCGTCGKSMGTRDHPEWGEVRYGITGLCDTCYQQERRAKGAS